MTRYERSSGANGSCAIAALPMMDVPRSNRYYPIWRALPGVTEDELFRGFRSEVRFTETCVCFMPQRAQIVAVLTGLLIPILVAWMFTPRSWAAHYRVAGTTGVFLVFCLLAPRLLPRRRKGIRVCEGPDTETHSSQLRLLKASDINRLAIVDYSAINPEISYTQLFAVTNSPEQVYLLFQRSRRADVASLAATLAARWRVPCVNVPEPDASA